MRRILDQEHAWCSFYALDPWAKGMPVVAVGIVARSLNAARRIVPMLADGIVVAEIEDGEQINDAVDVIKLRTATSLTLDIPGETKPRRYLLSYDRTTAQFSIGAEVGVVVRDATMNAGYGHVGYLLTSPEEPEDQRLARFFHLWGRVTGLPARSEWAKSLWSVGLKLELVQALKSYGLTGWRIDPRRSRPEGKPGWDHVLRILAMTS